jgi:hypothetical protein
LAAILDDNGNAYENDCKKSDERELFVFLSGTRGQMLDVLILKQVERRTEI